MGELLIRDATEDDAAVIAAIYAHHVLNGTATYDIDAPSVAETLAKLRHIAAAGWPFLVAQDGGEVAGYAYATQFRDRAAYRFACENSIYVAPDRMRRGVGKALLGSLLDRSAACVPGMPVQTTRNWAFSWSICTSRISPRRIRRRMP